jgi:shikimate kinase
MGSGKSTVSHKIASKLGYLRFDLDELFEQRYKISIQDFFQKYDESLFRKLESRLLKETVLLNKVVIATGGGTPCFYDNMEWMLEFGTTVFIHMQPGSLVKRLLDSKKKRPLLIGKTPEQLREFVQNQLRQRSIWYSQAHIILKGESLDINEAVDQIQQHISRNRSVRN